MLKINHNAGFFSCCSKRLEVIIEYYNCHKMLPLGVDSSQLFDMYKRNMRRDITYEYFKEDDSNFSKNDIRICQEDGEPQFTDYRKINYEDVGLFISKYFMVSNKIIKLIDKLENRYKIDYENICAVYYRGTDKILETNIATYDEFINKAKDVNQKVKFLVQTDEKEFRDKFIKEFGENRCIIIKEIDIEDKFMHSLYLLSIVIMISKMKYIICSSSNVSLWIMFYRGNANNVWQYLSHKDVIYGIPNKYKKEDENGWLR